MRPDVKLGVVISSVVVLVAGTYYFYRSGQEEPILLASGAGTQGLVDKPVASSKGRKPASTTAKPKTATRRNGKRLAQKKPASKLGKPAAPMVSAGLKDSAADLNKKSGGKLPTTRSKDKAPQRLANRNAGKRGNVARPKTSKPSPGNALAGGGPSGQLTTRNSLPAGAARMAVSLTATRPASAVNAVAVETHRVQRGDTLTSLAQRYYGDKSLATFLAKSNPQIVNAASPGVGQLVRIPPKPAKKQAVKPPASKLKTRGASRTYTVKSGDSFYKIAKNVLGDSSRWNELFELNRKLVGGDPKRLKPGQKVILPAS